MIILVDMDGVLADFEGAFLKTWRKRWPNEPFVPLEKRITFKIQDQYPYERRSMVEEIYRERGFYRHLPPIVGAIGALQTLADAGNHVVLCTAPLTGSPWCVQEKCDWVDEHLGKEWLKKLIITDDKTFVRGDILVDDKPKITGLLPPPWEHVIYDAPYNRDVTNKRRVSWSGDWRRLFCV